MAAAVVSRFICYRSAGGSNKCLPLNFSLWPDGMGLFIVDLPRDRAHVSVDLAYRREADEPVRNPMFGFAWGISFSTERPAALIMSPLSRASAPEFDSCTARRLGTDPRVGSNQPRAFACVGPNRLGHDHVNL